MKTIATRTAMIAGFALLAAGASAHPLDVPGAGYGAGFGHPFVGLDHLLAMLAVGLWASQHADRRARWVVPASFVSMMAIGGLLGIAGVAMPFAEVGIAGSLLILGALLALSVRLPLLTGALTVGLFAVMHGHVHGLEMPVAASPVAYGLGFLAATTVLHLAGLALGSLTRSGAAQRALRLASTGIAAYGVALILS